MDVSPRTEQAEPEDTLSCQDEETEEPVHPDSSGLDKEVPPVHTDAKPAEVESVAPRADDDLNWSSLAFELGLQSMAHQVAINSVVRKYQSQRLELAVEDDLQWMLKADIQQQISDAMAAKLGVSLKLTFVTVPELPCETPYLADQRIQEEQRQQVIQQIYADPVVQHLQKTFEAQLDESSVRKQKLDNA